MSQISKLISATFVAYLTLHLYLFNSSLNGTIITCFLYRLCQRQFSILKHFHHFDTVFMGQRLARFLVCRSLIEVINGFRWYFDMSYHVWRHFPISRFRIFGGFNGFGCNVEETQVSRYMCLKGTF